MPESTIPKVLYVNIVYWRLYVHWGGGISIWAVYEKKVEKDQCLENGSYPI